MDGFLTMHCIGGDRSFREVAMNEGALLSTEETAYEKLQLLSN